MQNLIHFYQHIPEKINPTIFNWGFFKLDWYSISYILGFLTVYFLLRYRLKEIVNYKKNILLDKNSLLDLLTYSFFGLLLGARLGYIIFYNFSYYWNNPLTIISPFDPISHEFIGIYGMSYHGGLLGVIIASLLFSKKYKINFWHLANFVAPAIPAGYFFGRIGNFLNGELYGRATEKFWGMYFPTDTLGLLRHPSQLYEAIFEGLVLFIILWKIRQSEKLKDKLLGIYLLGYAIFRIGIEFFREPDEQVGYLFGFLTLGQGLSFIMLFFGLFLFFRNGSCKPKKLP